MRNVVVSWTGGKDGCYACYNAMAEGYRVTHLLNFRNMKKTGSHELNPGIIQGQSEAMEIPLIQRDFFSWPPLPLQEQAAGCCTARQQLRYIPVQRALAKFPDRFHVSVIAMSRAAPANISRCENLHGD